VAKRSRNALTRGGVAAVAVRIADEKGLKAVTMRHLAAELGVEAMSLYHHIPGKEALFDAMVEAVCDEIVNATAQHEGIPSWKERIRERCLTARLVMLRHPWAPGLFGTQGKAPFGVMRQFDAVLGDLIEGGLSYSQGHRALHALGGMIIGLSSDPFALASDGNAEPVSPVEQEMMTQLLPNLTAMMQHEIHKANDPKIGWCDTQEEFEFTLDLLLNGIERER
jgi:AcrR family transcriptional regulator